MSRRVLWAAAGGDAETPPAIEEATIALFNGTRVGYRIGSATKTHGGAWTKYASNPVISVGSSGAWDDEHVKDPWLMRVSGSLVAYYAGRKLSTNKFQLGRATASSHTGPWTKYASNPVFTLGTSGAWDDDQIEFPVVLYEPTDSGREWKMWYSGYDGSAWRIGYAYSSDGIAWTRHAGNPVISPGSSGSWEDSNVLSMGVVRVGDTYWLSYAGSQNPSGNSRYQGGMASFTDPEGTYTKHAGNPVILARYNDAGTSQLLTANTTSGSAIVTVGSTAAWNVGEPMALADGDSETHIASIASIDSSTQITLDAVAPSTFSGGGSGTIRPFAYNSMITRSVRLAPGGGFEAFCTPFQPVSDLAPGGELLREGAMRMTAPAITGPWAYDYDSGLLWPLGGSTDWDRWSAENPSVLEA